MKQGVLLNHRVRLLLADGHSCYRARRTGERKRKSVRGCIVGSDIAVLSVIIVKVGEQEIPGLTDTVLPKRLGPKRATKIRRFFNLSKEDDVRKFVVRREVTPKKEGAKPYTKAPKIQRLVTPMRLQRRRHLQSLKKRRTEAQKETVKEYKSVQSNVNAMQYTDFPQGPRRQARRGEKGSQRRRQGPEEVCPPCLDWFLMYILSTALSSRVVHRVDSVQRPL
jgi:hypothetical protein